LKKPTKKKTRRDAPQLIVPSEEMKEWSVRLGEELATWPQVATKPMFGMLAYYRGPSIFAALPRTRTVETRDSFMYKLSGSGRAEKKGVGPGADWQTFAIRSAADLHGALRLLERAYEAAKPTTKKKRR
jgi:hypothetical protein